MILVINGDYEVRGLREEAGYIEGGFNKNDAHFFGVYDRLPPNPDDGHRIANHIADFNEYEDAVEYVNFKGAKHAPTTINPDAHDSPDHPPGKIFQSAQD